jgi:general secretion pathway protein L
MAQRILGLDLGAHAVKAVLLESAYRGYVVLGAAQVPVAPGEPPLVERQAAAIGALLAEKGWRADASVVALPGAAVSSLTVTLPFTDARRIEQTVAFEVEGQIPFELDQVAWDWQPIGQRDGKTDLLVAVVRREELAALLAALAGAGVDPRSVVPPGPAYATLLATGAVEPLPVEPGPSAGPGAEVVVDVGLERTSICLAVSGAVEAARTFPGGAALLARGPGPLVRELRATLGAWRARSGARPVRRLLLAGGAAATPGLAEALAAEVEGAVEPLALAGPAAAGVPAEEAPALALALALALRGHQGGRAGRLNLRRGPFAFTRDFEHVKGKVGHLAAYAALVLLLAVVSTGVKALALARQEAALDRALCDAQQKIIGKCYPNVEEAQAVLRGRGTPGGTLPRTTAVDVLAELSHRVPPEVKLRLDRIEITRDKLHLQGTTEAAESVDRIVTALQGSQCFGDARSGGARRRASDGKFEFSVDSALTCIEGGAAAPRE